MGRGATTVVLAAAVLATTGLGRATWGQGAGAPRPPADDYGATGWEVDRGPFGGDRVTVATDPADARHAITDSVDRSGIWETRDGGDSWSRANPADASFAQTNTRVALLRDPAGGGASLLVGAAGTAGQPTLFRLPLANPSRGPIEPLVGWSGPVQLLAVDPHPDRPGRIAVWGLDPTELVDLDAFAIGFSADGGRTWARRLPDNRLHVFWMLAFSADGSLLIPSAFSIAPADARRLVAARGLAAVKDLIASALVGEPLPAWATRAGVGGPRLLWVDPVSGACSRSADLGSVPLAVAGDPASGEVWVGTLQGLVRFGGRGGSASAVPLLLADGATLGPPLRFTGLTVARDPRDGATTVFASIAGGDRTKRGIWRGRSAGTDGEWRFERVSGGPSREFDDYPRQGVVVSAADSMLLWAPYCEDGMRVSPAFGDPGSWRTVQGGLTGYNIFGVEEDPSNPARVLCVAQNVVRDNTDGLTSSTWGDSFVSLDTPTANLRGGAEIDPRDPRRVLVGGGAGAGHNWNGGVWLTTDGGEIWTRVLGSEGDRDGNPQVYEVLQHPEAPDWILVASARHLGHGNAGVFSSTAGGAPGSFRKVLDAGDVWAVVPLPGSRALAGGAGGLFEIALTGGDVRATPLSGPGGVVTAVVFAGDIVVAGQADGAIYRKPAAALARPGGWERASQLGVPVSDLEASPARPGEVYAGTDGDGIWRSRDAGATWERFDDGLDSSEQTIFDLELSAPGDRLYAGTLGGLAVRRLPPR